MFRYLAVISLVLLATALGAPVYPRFSHVFNDPATYDLLYNVASGPINETLRFTRAVRLTSVVVPSQVIDFAGQGTYDEDISVVIYETVLNANPALVKTTQVASGRFTGTLNFGQEVTVPVHVDTEDGGEDVTEPPTMALYVNGSSGSQYTVNVNFGKTGIYPWYNARKFSSSATIHNTCDIAGYVIGLSYSLVV